MSSHNHANHAASTAVKAGAAAAASTTGVGAKLLHTAAKHPVLVFGIGILAGVYLYKNRQQIIESEEHDCCDS